MKIRNLTGALLITLMLLGSTQTLFAQEVSEREIRKELRVILKDLPVEAQQDILRYAEAKQAMVARQAAAEESRPNATPAQATPAPAPQPAPAAAPAQPATPAAVTVNPGQSAVTPTPAGTGHAPQRPKYMMDAEAMAATTVDWGQTNHDFGQIPQGETVRHTFRFKNTGDEPLRLTRVKASCGCTTPSYSSEPIAPGEEGFIEVAFNSRGRSGPQRKTVVVTGNFEPVNMILRFQGEVVTP